LRYRPPATLQVMAKTQELRFFAPGPDGDYVLRPGRLNSYSTTGELPVPGPEYLTALFQRVRKFPELPDHIVKMAIMTGIVSNAAFLSIIDATLTLAPCLCCYRARNKKNAEEAEEQIGILMGYYTQSSYEGSNMFYRTAINLQRDVTGTEMKLIKKYVPRRTRGPAEAKNLCDCVRDINRITGVCAIYTYHERSRGLYDSIRESGWADTGLLGGKGLSLCFYSTVKGRRFLRALRKKCKTRALTLATRLVSGTSYEYYCLRYKFRSHVVEIYPMNESAALADFWKSVKEALQLFKK
jgi:hypothetical protein